MDGPNVNWEVLKMLNEHRQEKRYSDIFNMGSCSLHVVHGALQTAINSQKWELEKIFRAMYNLFKESPAKIDEYIRVCETDLLALPFCATRWVEDEGVASRGIVVWPNMVKIIKYWESLCKSKRPKNKS
nr:uncharacterized protein LOC124812369 [Hydra vulgaris]